MSEQLAKFYDVVAKHFEKLELWTTAITRAHGNNHPEAFEVRSLFKSMREKVENAGKAKPELDEEFNRLRTVTNQYEVPEDVCETYEGVYEMLLEADQAYNEK